MKKKQLPNLCRHTTPKSAAERQKELRGEALREGRLYPGAVRGRKRFAGQSRYKDVTAMVKRGMLKRHRAGAVKMTSVVREAGTALLGRSIANRTYAKLVESWMPPATRRGEKGRQAKPNRAQTRSRNR